MTPLDLTREPPFGMNGLVGLQQNQYYWFRHPDGTKFIAKLENNLWWVPGAAFAVDVTRDQVIYPVRNPEN